jgi:hypothetical protein
MEKTDLSVVLALLVREYGGELRISKETIEDPMPQAALTFTVDEAAQQWVIQLEEMEKANEPDV